MLKERTLKVYDNALNNQRTMAEKLVRNSLYSFINKNKKATVSDIREYAIEVINNIVQIYGDNASAIAVELYSKFAEQTSKKTKDPIIVTDDVKPYINKEMHYKAQKLVNGDMAGFVDAAGSCANEQVGRRANDTMIKNCKRDRVRFARVPSGGETCNFCLMLASRGFVYASKQSAGENKHFHAHCRCKIVPEFDGGIAGYDPGAIYDKWQDNLKEKEQDN